MQKQQAEQLHSCSEGGLSHHAGQMAALDLAGQQHAMCHHQRTRPVVTGETLSQEGL